MPAPSRESPICASVCGWMEKTGWEGTRTEDRGTGACMHAWHTHIRHDHGRMGMGWTWGTRARNQPRQIALAGWPYST